MTVRDAQADMRQAYGGGAAGLLASSIAWLAAGIVALTAGPRPAIATLFFGGMLIHPVGLLLVKFAGRSGAHRKDNPLGALALEGTVWMLLAFPAAFLLSFQRPTWFFLALLLTIGGRYLTFATLYGTRLYWACGALLALASFALFATDAPLASAAFTGAAIELVFSVVVFRATRGETGPKNS